MHESDELTASFMSELQARFPDVPIEQLAKNVGSNARSKRAVLTSLCQKWTPGKTTETSDKPPEHAGHWWPDGSWESTGNESDYWDAPSGSITRFVRKLVYMRRNENLTPRQAADLIALHGKTDAFPAYDQWREAENWLKAVTLTSAEAAVRYSGDGSNFKHDARVEA